MGNRTKKKMGERSEPSGYWRRRPLPLAPTRSARFARRFFSPYLPLRSLVPGYPAHNFFLPLHSLRIQPPLRAPRQAVGARRGGCIRRLPITTRLTSVSLNPALKSKLAAGSFLAGTRPELGHFGPKMSIMKK